MEYYTQCMQIKQQTVGEDHPDFCRVLNRLATVYVEQNKLSVRITAHHPPRFDFGRVHRRIHPFQLLMFCVRKPKNYFNVLWLSEKRFLEWNTHVLVKP
jgi:hypothetical protein